MKKVAKATKAKVNKPRPSASATRLRCSVSGLGISELATAFRLKPILDGDSVGCQLREWAAGMPKDAATKRKIVHRCCTEVIGDVEGPVDADLACDVAAEILMRWCSWADATAEADDHGFASVWLIEHTVRLFGMMLGAVRHAWEVPSRAPTVEDWFPSGTDEKPLPASYVDAVLTDLQRRQPESKLVDLLATARFDDDGKATKPDTVKRWRTGMTIPNGEHVSEIQRAVSDPRFRLLLGARALLERLACVPNAETGAAPPAAQRNTTMVWMLHAEVTASNLQKIFADRMSTSNGAVASLASPAVLHALLPPLTSPPGPLPYELQKQSALVVDVRKGDRYGKIVLLLPNR